MPLLRKSANLVKVGTVALSLVAMTLAHQSARATYHSGAAAVAASEQAASDMFNKGVSDLKGIYRT